MKTGYRINHEGVCEVAGTMCQCHNETVNIWTHFIGSITFLILIAIIICLYQN
jgi:predicted membrane channel-forming protein YqfA (hemolysin III family)